MTQSNKSDGEAGTLESIERIIKTEIGNALVMRMDKLIMESIATGVPITVPDPPKEYTDMFGNPNHGSDKFG